MKGWWGLESPPFEKEGGVILSPLKKKGGLGNVNTPL